MATNKRKFFEQDGPEQELARNVELFFEADRLETAAYDIIGTSQADAQAWLRFSEAKQLADEKRTQAYADLMRIRRGTLKQGRTHIQVADPPGALS